MFLTREDFSFLGILQEICSLAVTLTTELFVELGLGNCKVIIKSAFSLVYFIGDGRECLVKATKAHEKSEEQLKAFE